MPGAPRVIVVLSGNELLDGRTRDTNGAFVTDDLSRRGAKVTELITVADDAERLDAVLRHALDAAPDLLVIGGGLGTTHDDLTASCLADVLGVPLAENAQALGFLEERLRVLAHRRHLDFDEVLAMARRQALLPAGSSPVPPAGVAPGIAARAGGTRIFALPGVPFEFEAMWATIAAELEHDDFFPDVAVRMLRMYGVGEMQVAPLFDELPCDLLDLGIKVGGGEVTVRLRYRREEAAERQADAVVAALEAGAPVFSRDGRTIDEIIAGELRGSGSTLAVAESCTGGLLGARITSLPGSSEYFVGGVLSYANEVKADLLDVPREMLAQYGAVSEAVAAAMAEGARDALRSDYALAGTGVAGPDGGTPEKPVGLVYVACASAAGTAVHRGTFPGDRETVRTYSSPAARHLLLRTLSP